MQPKVEKLNGEKDTLLLDSVFLGHNLRHLVDQMEYNVVENISPVVDAIFNILKPFCLPAKCFEKLTRSIYQLSYIKTTQWSYVNS